MKIRANREGPHRCHTMFRSKGSVRLGNTNIPAVSESDGVDDDLEVSNYTYEKALYTEFINALHKSGLYEEADQLYASGVSNGHLP